jgi:SHS2 domain-containing protein
MHLKAHSTSPSALFEDLAQQLFNSLIDPQDVGAALREKIAVDGESLEQLLREWIEALLGLVRVQHMVFSQIRILKLQTPDKGPYTLQAEAVGELLDSQRHVLDEKIAWLKCTQVQLRKSGEEYSAEVILSQ